MSQTKQKPFEIRFDRIVVAYKTVKANKGSYGVDGISLEAYEVNLQDNLYKLWNRMSSGSYFPQAVRQVEIDKKGGGKRPLGIPSVADRVAQAVVKRELEIMLEPVFHEDSFGYRRNRGVLDAVGKARERCWRYKWALDIDIKSFFEDISHELLMKAVRKHTNCKWHLLYIERWLKAPVQQVDGSVKEKVKGTPQGAVISPILANLFLHYAFDEWMRRNIPHCPFERYADDIVVHCDTKSSAAWVESKLETRFQQCGLTLHPVKTKIVDCRTVKESKSSEHQEFDFLGHTFRKRKAKTKQGEFFTSYLPAVSKKAVKAIQEKVKECEPLAKTTGTLKEIATELNPKIRGWFNIFSKFYISEFKRHIQFINWRLMLWAKRKFKRLRRNRWNAKEWLRKISTSQPTLFEHWKHGVTP
jgi:RNA-directed DNA polymerase